MTNCPISSERKDACADSHEDERRIEEEDEEYKICKEIIDQAAETNKDYREAYELYLSKVVDYEAIKWGTFSGSVRIEKWDESGLHPLEVVITLEYKTGDAVNIPYANHPILPEFLAPKAYSIHKLNKILASLLILLPSLSLQRTRQSLYRLNRVLNVNHTLEPILLIH